MHMWNDRAAGNSVGPCLRGTVRQDKRPVAFPVATVPWREFSLTTS